MLIFCEYIVFCLQILESELKIKQQQVSELETQASHLKEIDPEKEEVIRAKKVVVEERFVSLC